MLDYIIYTSKKNNFELYTKGFKSVCINEIDYQVCVDGEAYNLDEICPLLELNQKTTSIEEIFMSAYLKWNDQAFVKIEGAYSFSYYDRETINVYKDPLGLKPVFYYFIDDTLCISNKISSILKKCDIPAILSREGIIELFAFGPSISEDKTLFKNIAALPMGCNLKFANNNVCVKKHYKLPIHEHKDDVATTINKVHDLVTRSILQQSIGCKTSFLSGGLDSSIITSVCSREHSSWITHSLQYEGNKDNFTKNNFQVSLDDEFITEMVDTFHLSHNNHTVPQKSLVELLDQSMSARECPGMADIDSSLLWLCNQVSPDYDTIFSGECSDEIFGGYPWFYQDSYKDINTFPWLQSTKQRIEMLNPSIRDFDYQAYIEKQYKKTVKDVEYLPSDTPEDRNARQQHYLCLHWFMQTLVTRQVCIGDYAKINIRAPFANIKILEYVYNIPWRLKFINDMEKGILRKAFEKELPSKISKRKKNPFPKTHNPQYAILVSEELIKRMQDQNSLLFKLFDQEQLQNLIDTKGSAFPLPWYGQLMSGPQLIGYLCQIDEWGKQFDIQVESK